MKTDIIKNLDDANARIEELNKDLKAANLLVSTHVATISSHEGEITVLKKNHEDEVTAHTATKGVLTKAQTDLTAAQGDVTRLTGELGTATTNVGKLTNEVSVLNTEVNHLKSESKTVDQRVIELTGKSGNKPVKPANKDAVTTVEQASEYLAAATDHKDRSKRYNEVKHILFPTK